MLQSKIKKITNIVLVIFSISQVGCAESLDGKHYISFPMSSYSFKDSVFRVEELNADTGELDVREYIYTEHKVDGVPFIELTCGESSEQMLVLYSDSLLFMYNQNEFFPIRRAYSSFETEETIYSPKDHLEVSSYLIEGNTAYLPINLGSVNLEEPWVEGASGKGEGEVISLGRLTSRRLWLSNGFVSFEDPSLYFKNGRLKAIRILDRDTGEKWDIELEDTPNPQLIDLGPRQRRDLEIQITDVYSGSTYEDTCINFILVEA